MRCKFSLGRAVGIIGPNGDNTSRVGRVVISFHTGPPGSLTNSRIVLIGSCRALGTASGGKDRATVSRPRGSGILR